MKKIAKILLLSILTFIFLAPTFTIRTAAEQTKYVIAGQEFNPESTMVIDGRNYVTIRAFADAVGAQISWNSELKEVSLTKDKTLIQFYIDEERIIYNFETLYMDSPTLINNEVVYVPLRFIAEALHYNVIWDPTTSITYIEEKPTYTVKEGDTLEQISELIGISIEELKSWNALSEETLAVGSKIYLEPVNLTAIDELKTKAVIAYADDELEWLARIVYAEAHDEPYEGLVAVAAVVINRVQDQRFPNTIYDVIFQPSQFTPVRTGKIYNIKPDQASYKAAREALLGNDPVEGALYFYNPNVTKSSFFSEKKVIGQIGNHRFVR